MMTNTKTKDKGALPFFIVLLLSPVLLDLSSEIDGEVAQLLAAHFDAVEVVYSMPGAGKCQSMATGDIAEGEEGSAPPYFGFPIE